MPLLPLLLLAPPLPAGSAGPPACVARQLSLSVDGKDGAFDGMSHSGTELSIRNTGADCTLPALPVVRFLDARGRVLPAGRRAPPGMHPGPVMVPVRLGGGHRAASDLRWVSGPVYAHSRSVRAAFVTVRIGGAVLRARCAGVLYGAAGVPLSFDQPPLRATEGMAAG